MSITINEKSFCRICGNILDDFNPDQSNVTTFKNVIRQATGIDISKDKPGIHPVYLCHECVQKLNKFSLIPKRKTGKFKEKFNIVSWDIKHNNEYESSLASDSDSCNENGGQDLCEIQSQDKIKCQSNTVDCSMDSQDSSIQYNVKVSGSETSCLTVSADNCVLDMKLKCCECDSRFQSYAELLVHLSSHARESGNGDQEGPLLTNTSAYNSPILLQHGGNLYLLPTQTPGNGIVCPQGQPQVLLVPGYLAYTGNNATCGKLSDSETASESKESEVSESDKLKLKVGLKLPEVEITCPPNGTSLKIDKLLFNDNCESSPVDKPKKYADSSCSKSFNLFGEEDENISAEGNLVIDESGDNQDENDVDPLNFCSVSIDNFSEISDEGYQKSDVTLNRIERKKECPYCQRLCSGTTALKRHILVHTGERPFACKFCPAAYTRKFVLQRHIEVNHPENLQDSDKRFKCPHCTTICYTSKRLTRHIVVFHNSETISKISNSSPKCNSSKIKGSNITNNNKNGVQENSDSKLNQKLCRDSLLKHTYSNVNKRKIKKESQCIVASVKDEPEDSSYNGHETGEERPIKFPKCDIPKINQLMDEDPDPEVLSDLMSSELTSQNCHEKFEFQCEQCSSKFRYRAEYIYHLLHHDK